MVSGPFHDFLIPAMRVAKSRQVFPIRSHVSHQLTPGCPPLTQHLPATPGACPPLKSSPKEPGQQE